MYVWCKHSAAEVHTNTRMGEADAPTLLLDTARRMRVAGQICLRDVEKPFTVTAVEIGDLPAGVTAAYQHVENMIYHDGVPYPDKLSLATSVTVRINVTHVIWVLIDVDETAEAGLYRIPVTLRTDTGDQAVSFTLRIYPVTLPLPSDPGTFGHEYFFDAFSFAPKQPAPIKAPCEPFYACLRYSDEWWELMAEFARTMKSLRVNSLNIAPMALLLDAGSKKKPDGGWELRFDLLDSFIEHFLTHGAFRYIAIGAIIGAVDGKAIRAIGEEGNLEWLPIGAPEADAWAEAFYGGIYHHFKEKGWLDMLLMRLQDEPHAKDYWLWAREKCRQFMPGVRCGEPLDTHAVGRELADACDQYIPRLEVYEEGADFYQQRLAKGDELWCYSCCLPEEPWWLNKFMDLPHRYSRLIKWACYGRGITGFLHWGFNFWGDSRYGLFPEARFKGDGFIVYPHAQTNGLLMSVRGIATCEGIQEWELLKMLGAHDPAAARSLSRRVARTFRDFDPNEDAVDEAKRELLSLLSAYAE